MSFKINTERVKNLCADKGLTYAELSRITGIHPTLTSRILKSGVCGRKNLLRLAEGLGVTPESISGASLLTQMEAFRAAGVEDASAKAPFTATVITSQKEIHTLTLLFPGSDASRANAIEAMCKAYGIPFYKTIHKL